MSDAVEDHLAGLAACKIALKVRVEAMCAHFDNEAVRIVPDQEVSLFNGLFLTGTALVRILDEERADWIRTGLAVISRAKRGKEYVEAHRARVEGYLGLAYEAETQRLMQHIDLTIGEEIARRERLRETEN